MVVENSDEVHLKKAMWLFPLYLLLINIFVPAIAGGGLLLKIQGSKMLHNNHNLTPKVKIG